MQILYRFWQKSKLQNLFAAAPTPLLSLGGQLILQKQISMNEWHVVQIAKPQSLSATSPPPSERAGGRKKKPPIRKAHIIYFQVQITSFPSTAPNKPLCLFRLEVSVHTRLPFLDILFYFLQKIQVVFPTG